MSEFSRRFIKTLRQYGLFNVSDLWSHSLQQWPLSQDTQLAGRFAWSTVPIPRLHGNIQTSKAVNTSRKRLEPYEPSGSRFSCNTETSGNATVPSSTRRPSPKTWIPSSVCSPWGPFSFYVWTAVLTASYLGLSCRPGQYLKVWTDSFKSLALKLLEGSDSLKRNRASKVQISVRCCPMMDQQSYPKSRVLKQAVLPLIQEETLKQVLGQVNVCSLWLAPEGPLSKIEAPDGQRHCLQYCCEQLLQGGWCLQLMCSGHTALSEDWRLH